jgi:hypothetical protein
MRTRSASNGNQTSSQCSSTAPNRPSFT